MAIEIYSGKDAYVEGVPCTSSWQITQAASAQRFSASCVAGASNVGPPIINWSGQASGYGAQPVLFPSGTDLADTLLVTNADAGEGDLLSLQATILVEQLTIDINKETNAPISWTATFGTQGNPTESASAASDSTVADVLYGDALDVCVGSTPTSIGVDSVRSAQIVLRRQTTTYVIAGQTYRKAGFLSADISFSVYKSSLISQATAFAAGVLDKLRIYTTASAYWEFQKARFLGKNNYVVDRSSNNIVGYTVQAQWNAADAGTAGWLTYHNGTAPTDYWGDSTP